MHISEKMCICDEYPHTVASVFHRIVEMQGDKVTGTKRQDWDIKGWGNIFQALKLKLTVESIKLCVLHGDKRE